MRVFASLRSVVSALFHRSRVENEMEEELRAHIQDRAKDLERSGVPRAEAERRARLEFGGYEKFKEEIREAQGVHFLETLIQDLRYAFRMLRKSPGFTAVAVLTLALGIGANTAIFSVVYSSLLRPLPFPNSSQLVDVWGHSSFFDFYVGISLPDIADVRAQNTVFSDFAPYNYAGMTLTGTGAPQSIDTATVSAGFFPLLGIKPLYGRIFTAAETQPGQEREAILSYELWQTQFGADPRAVGKSITLDGNPYTIIGVMPRQQNLGDVPMSQDLWMPFAPTAKELADRGNHTTYTIARLKPGVTVKQTQAELDAIGAGLAKTYPNADQHWGFHVVSLESDIVGDRETPLLVLLGAVGFLLLIACANIGNLFLSRGWTRRRELAIRTALGATRGRLIRQLLVESLLIALVGGVCGLLLAIWGAQALRTLLPPDMPRVKDLGIDQAVLWFTLGASIFAGILFGLAPAVVASRQELTAVIKEGGAGAQGGASSIRHKFLRQLLVVGEVALALLLVIGATLALRSFARLRSVDLGFRSDHLLTMTVTFPAAKYGKPEQFIPYVRQILALTRSIPGVEDAGASMYTPFSGSLAEATVNVEAASPASQAPTTEFNRATPGYFRTLDIPLLAGRAFTDADTADAPRVYIVNQVFARKFFGNASPIGKRIWSGKDAKNNPQWGEIVGEVGNFRDRDAKEAPRPDFFSPYDQGQSSSGISLAVRTKGNPLALVSGIQDRIRSINKAQPIDNVSSMEQAIAQSNAQPRFQTSLLGVFGALGLVLALVGIYGVISYSVTQRTHEIGIRMALGAEPGQVMRLFLKYGLSLALIGVTIGVTASLALTRLMSSLLFGVSATDPVTFTGVAILLVLVSLAACYIPARRAMRVDPMVALRHE
jgi:putative ABC transport system permease protein